MARFLAVACGGFPASPGRAGLKQVNELIAPGLAADNQQYSRAFQFAWRFSWSPRRERIYNRARMRSAVLLLSASILGFAADPPRPSLPLSMERLNAPPVTIAQYRGKVVALTFILTSCSHCQDLTKILNRLAPEYAPRGVQFVECAVNGNAKSEIKEFLQRFQPPFPVGWADEAAARAFLRMPPANERPLYIPHMVFLDRVGMIRTDVPAESDFFNNPEANVRAEVEKLLKFPSSPESRPVHR
jgi:hypothetical protein